MRLVLMLTGLVVAGCTGRLEAPPEQALETVTETEAPPRAAPLPAPPAAVLDDGFTTRGPGRISSAPPSAAQVVPVRGLRRLTQAEVSAAASQLLGVDAGALAEALGSDARQSGFTRNVDQRVGAAQAQALFDAAAAVAATVEVRALVPCETQPCLHDALAQLAERAFRRRPSPEELERLQALFDEGARSGGDGARLVVQALLQSPSFLYVTELGTADEPGRLTGEELATSLALLFTGAPPDDALLALGRSGALEAGEDRARVARELLATPAGHRQVQRLVLEWLGADQADVAPKDEALFPGWEAVAPDVLAESRALIDAVLFDGPGTLAALLTATQTTVSPSLASWYGLPAPGPQAQPPGRRGLLLAGAFTAANALPDGTAPVRRGALIRRKLLCQNLPLPSGEGTNLVVPPPDPTRTTRERFAAHTASDACATCHALLDPIGFALERFDAVGRYRETENDLPIDASGVLVSAGDADGPFTDAVGLVTQLASSSAVRTCFARHLVRFALGHASVDDERAFVDWVRERDSGREGLVLELLVDWARRDAFAARREP